MKKYLSAVVLVVSMCAIAASPALAEEAMSPAKRKLLEKTKKDSAAAKAVFEAGESRGPLLDLNKASKQQLMNLPGIGEAEADKIIAARPFFTKTQLRKQELVPLATFYDIIDKVEVVVEIKKYEPPVPPAPSKKEQAQAKSSDKPKRDMKDVFK